LKKFAVTLEKLSALIGFVNVPMSKPCIYAKSTSFEKIFQLAISRINSGDNRGGGRG